MKKLMLVAGMALSFAAMPALAQFKYVEGRDYQPITNTIDNAEAPKVIEFFWFGCPHCDEIHEPLEQWVKEGKPDKVTFEMVPAMPSPRWETAGHLYYAAKALKMDVSDKVFDEVHKKGNLGIIFDADKAKAYLVSLGADKKAVDKAWDSFGVQQDMERAKTLFNASGLDGVPSFIVNGKYQVPFRGDTQTFFPKLGELAQSPLTQPK